MHSRILVALAFISLAAAALANLSELRRAFERPPDEARIMMRWWWFGPAVTKAGLEREMRLMKEGGIGGFEVQPVYPLILEGNLKFLSPEFLDALRFTAEKARELGLRMDLTLGSGWPFGGPQVPVTQAAPRLRLQRVRVDAGSPRVPVPSLQQGEEFVAAFAGERELTDIKDGAVAVPDRAVTEVSFFIASRTRQMVKRAAVGAEGFVLDHYDRAALDNYLKRVGGPLLDALGGRTPYAIFCDSLEVFGSDWTGDLLTEFRKRRGYDLKPHLPALAAEVGKDFAGVRHDWGRTLTELLDDRFLAPMHDWARQHKTLFRIQNYGIPPATIASNRFADISEGEGAQWKVVRASRWASSANHLYGRPVTTSETWTWLHSPVFAATPLDMKAEADLHFVQGINQLIGHGWPYTAEGVEYPGWRFYAAAVFNEKNPWWIVMPDLSRYLQRVSFLLRQGRPANDVALYLPTSDAWAHFSLGRVHMIDTLRERVGNTAMPQILEAGYGLDFFDDGTLEQALGGKRYRIVVLPGVERMPAATAQKLDAFARGGGIVIATRRAPDRAPGLMATEADHAAVRAFGSRLKLVADENQLGAALKAALTPDLNLTPAVPEIGFIHRSLGFAEVYFVINSSNVRQKTTAAFRVGRLNPEWWDPMTGATFLVSVLGRSAGTVSVALDLEPYGSRVLVFSAGAPVRLRDRAPGETLDISTGWKVTFGEKGAPQERGPWPEHYSGTATYERSVDIPGALAARGVTVKLDFGEGKPATPPAPRRGNPGMQAWLEAPVREAAVVYVNGARAGAVWCPPYSVDVTRFLERGRNQIRIVVANLALNHMAGRPLPNYKELNQRFGVRFEPQDMDKVRPAPAGLLGPIRLIAEKR